MKYALEKIWYKYGRSFRPSLCRKPDMAAFEMQPVTVSPAGNGRRLWSDLVALGLDWFFYWLLAGWQQVVFVIL